MEDYTKLFSRFDALSRTRSAATAFSDLLDFCMVPMKRYDTLRQRSTALATLTSNGRIDHLLALAAEIGDCAEGFHDPLGALYEAKISKGRNGQFFTPEHLADLLASLGNLDEATPEQTLCDCACGSGRLLLAAAKVNRQLRLYGADIDQICCKIAVVNMLLHSLTGEIAHMDSLANTFYRGYKIGTFLKDGYHHPYYIEFTDPQESSIWLRPEARSTGKPNTFDTPFEPTSSGPTVGVQGSLFD